MNLLRFRMYKSAKKWGGVLTKLLHKLQPRRQKDGDIMIRLAPHPCGSTLKNKVVVSLRSAELSIFEQQNGKLAKNRGGVLYIYTLSTQ
jgi:hypothetical protein